jgi:preprotein translocase subunit Sec61beta
MPVKTEKVSMPMASAGIIGFSPDVKISGMEVEPKFLLAAIVTVVIIVRAASYAIG